MRFPNAARGVKKLFTAEILSILSAVSLIVCVVMMAFTVTGAAKTSANGQAGFTLASLGASLIFLIAFFVLALISKILKLVGLLNASHDEKSFKTALFVLLFSIVLFIVADILIGSHTAFNILYACSTLFEFFSLLFILAGIVKLADQMNRGDISKKGSGLVKLLLVIAVLSFVISIVSSFTGSLENSVLTVVLTIVTLVLGVVESVMYISLLSKAKKMLLLNK